MAYDEELAGRIRELVSDEPALTEKTMFGGLAFLVQGNMAVAASGQGGILVRVDPSESDALVGGSKARPMEMRGREMPGWLRLDTEDVRLLAAGQVITSQFGYLVASCSRNSDGVAPSSRRTTRARCAWSAKPRSAARRARQAVMGA